MFELGRVWVLLGVGDRSIVFVKAHDGRWVVALTPKLEGYSINRLCDAAVLTREEATAHLEQEPLHPGVACFVFPLYELIESMNDGIRITAPANARRKWR